MTTSHHPRTLAIDIGGTGLKMLALDAAGAPLTERTRVLTPQPATPAAVIEALREMAAAHGEFDRVSVGFPGVVVDGVTLNAPNLGTEHWTRVALAERLADALGAPVRAANDADVQGYGAIEGRGLELTITLGTGMGSALFYEGTLIPNLELGHHPGPFSDGSTYEDNLGQAALDALGQATWRAHLQRAIQQMHQLFNYRMLFIGGGNARLIDFALPENATVVSNRAGLYGGIHLW